MFIPRLVYNDTTIERNKGKMKNEVKKIKKDDKKM